MSCSKKKQGPGYAGPLQAMHHGPREKLLFVTCVSIDQSCADYLATVDVDPESSDYGRVVQRCYMAAKGDELHHSVSSMSACHHSNPYSDRGGTRAAVATMRTCLART